MPVQRASTSNIVLVPKPKSTSVTIFRHGRAALTHGVGYCMCNYDMSRTRIWETNQDLMQFADQCFFDSSHCILMYFELGHQIVKEHVVTAHHIPQNTCRVHLFRLQDHLFFRRFVFHFDRFSCHVFVGCSGAPNWSDGWYTTAVSVQNFVLSSNQKHRTIRFVCQTQVFSKWPKCILHHSANWMNLCWLSENFNIIVLRSSIQPWRPSALARTRAWLSCGKVTFGFGNAFVTTMANFWYGLKIKKVRNKLG